MIRVGVNLGNSQISCIVCDIKSNDKIKLLSFINRPTKNIKKSLITDTYKIKNELKEIIDQAEKESQTEIASIRINASVVNSLHKYFSNEISVSGEQINDLHLKKYANQTEILDPIPNYSITHRSIISYELDNQPVTDPRGMYGDTLNVFFYKLAIKDNYINTINNIFQQLDISIENYVPSPLSSALATLKEDEKQLGCISLDLGAGSTSIAVYENNKLIYLDAIPIGGQHITNDIARGLSTTIESSERLKTLHGSVISNPSDDYDFIDVPILGSDQNQSKEINRSELNSIIKPRVEETLELARQKLIEYNINRKPIRNLVLTGGGALLEGVEDYAQTIFDSKTRIGKPKVINGMLSSISKPQFSQTFGLIFYNEDDYNIDFLAEKKQKIKKNKIFSRFFAWLDQYI